MLNADDSIDLVERFFPHKTMAVVFLGTAYNQIWD